MLMKMAVANNSIVLPGDIWLYVGAGLLFLVLLVIFIHLYVQWRVRNLVRDHLEAREQFEQTAEALSSAIDAKDTYTNGHSRRVAEYSVKIAKKAGKSEAECNRIYFAALLHDVGKIGVPIEILTKNGKLTTEEFEQIKQHPVIGGQILSSIRNSPWLSTAARYHHERYNGKGYPEGLKGEDIPEIARIIAVADAYDAMTSNRSYRKAIPQHIVREELVKGKGTEFDPEFTRLMIHMIDKDTEYRMKEAAAGKNMPDENSIQCKSLYEDCTDGVLISKYKTGIRFCSQPDDGVPADQSLPTLILFDSLDGKVHPGEEKNKNLLYFEYARIRMDGQVTEVNTRNTEVSVLEHESMIEPARSGEPENGQRYIVEAVRNHDHVMIRISDDDRTIRIILALPDSIRFAYISVGGENCCIHNILVEKSETETDPDSIPRIAEEISYIKDCPVGDIPNIQVDSWCGEATKGVRLGKKMALRFHSKSLPTARLVWHCPYVSVFSSSDGQRNGEGFREYILLRIDGEDWSSDEHVRNEIHVEQHNDFVGWEEWKNRNMQGLDCVVEIKRDKNVISIETENLGIAINSVTTILDDVKDIYIALTGDQCAVTDIHIE
ncbi:MAG: HD-GYP domain-containing protein [Lachnospiraceae bacterium]|nr:HD-GYP domain-containing protein [Lachnospiraceae bacterium]